MTSKIISVTVPSDDARMLRAAADMLDTCADWLESDARESARTEPGLTAAVEKVATNPEALAAAVEIAVSKAPAITSETVRAIFDETEQPSSTPNNVAESAKPDVQAPAEMKIGYDGPPAVPAPVIMDAMGVFPQSALVTPIPIEESAPITTAAPAPATATTTDMAPAVTLNGLIPWDERIHSRGRSKTKNGCWKTKRECPDTELRAVEAELLTANPAALPSAPTPASVPVVPAPVAPAPVVPAPTIPAVTTPAVTTPVAPGPTVPKSYTFQDLMTVTNKLGYNNFQKIQELNSILKAWTDQKYTIVAEIAMQPEVMASFAAHLQTINGVQ